MQNKNLGWKKILSILLGIIIVFATFYFVYENLYKTKYFNVCIYPEVTTFSQGENLPIAIIVNTSINNFQSYFPGNARPFLINFEPLGLIIVSEPELNVQVE